MADERQRRRNTGMTALRRMWVEVCVGVCVHACACVGQRERERDSRWQFSCQHPAE